MTGMTEPHDRDERTDPMSESIVVSTRNGLSNLEVAMDPRGDVVICFGWDVKTMSPDIASKLAKAINAKVKESKQRKPRP